MFSEELKTAIFNASSDVLSDLSHADGELLAELTVNQMEITQGAEYDELISLINSNGWALISKQMQQLMASNN